jgi:Cdc6-like AAA superfamily ATPase
MGFFRRLIGGRAPERPHGLIRQGARPQVKAPRSAIVAMPAPGESQHPTLSDVFTPTRPQRSARRVTGRHGELSRIFRALALDRAHVVLYGERGRGKTSIVNLVASSARSAGYMVARYACSTESDFDEIVRGLARDLPPPLLAVPLQHGGHLQGCEAALPAERIQPRDIVGLPGRLTGRHLVLVIDEFDRVEDTDTRTRFADTIKQVSDRGAALSFVIVGVSDSLEELLGRHPSIQRNILGLPLPLLTDEQIEEVLQRGGREAGINFPHEIKQSIVAISRGVPYIAQLLGLHAGIEALARRSANVDMADFEAACARALDEMDPRVAALYSRLVGRYAEANMRPALLAVASSGEQDRFGRFTAMPAKGGWLVAGQHLTTEQWTLMLEMAAVRECPSAGYGVFAFADAMLQHYVLLEAVLSAGPRQAAAPDPRRGSIEAWNADPQLVPGTGTHG